MSGVLEPSKISRVRGCRRNEIAISFVQLDSLEKFDLMPMKKKKLMDEKQSPNTCILESRHLVHAMLNRQRVKPDGSGQQV